MVSSLPLFEKGAVYWCSQDTHLIDYKLTKKAKHRYRLSQRAIKINRGDSILCLDVSEKDGQIQAIFLVRDEFVHIQEHNSTLRALQKVLVKIGR